MLTEVELSMEYPNLSCASREIDSMHRYLFKFWLGRHHSCGVRRGRDSYDSNLASQHSVQIECRADQC